MKYIQGYRDYRDQISFQKISNMPHHLTSSQNYKNL